MNLCLALRRLLPLLAVLSLALAPVTASAAAGALRASTGRAHHATMGDQGVAGMNHAAKGNREAPSVDTVGMDTDDMPCCPRAEAAEPDCAKGCPLMALCLANVASLLPAAPPVPMPVATRASASWPEPAAFASVYGSPVPEPPIA